jgi:translation initiation factor 1
MDLKDQLQNLFPDHVSQEADENDNSTEIDIWLQDEPLLCKYEKRKGKPITIIEGYNGAKKDFKMLAQILKKELSVGGGIKNKQIIVQGDYRDRIMEILKRLGFGVKRVGG